MVDVVKRDGRTEAFDGGKLRRSLEKAVIDADLRIDDKWGLITKILKQVTSKANKQAKIDTDTIRKMVLAEFDRMEPFASKSWRAFDNKYKSE